MAELKIRDGDFAAANLASYGVAQKQPEGPKLGKGQEPIALQRYRSFFDRLLKL